MIDYREKLEDFRNELVDKFIRLCCGNDFNKLTLIKIADTIDEVYEKHILKATMEIDVMEIEDRKMNNPCKCCYKADINYINDCEYGCDNPCEEAKEFWSSIGKKIDKLLLKLKEIERGQK